VPDRLLRGTTRVAPRCYSRSYESQAEMWLRHPDRILLTLWGGNISMRRSDALRVGIYNPNFTGRYFEDWELGLRCHAARLTGLFDPALRGAHHYRRGVRAWLREGRVQGAAHVQLGIDWKSSPLDHLAGPAVSVLMVVVLACGALRQHWLERRVAYRVRRLQMRLGAREARSLEVRRPPAYIVPERPPALARAAAEPAPGGVPDSPTLLGPRA
jgi:hypothetical protein